METRRDHGLQECTVGRNLNLGSFFWEKKWEREISKTEDFSTDVVEACTSSGLFTYKNLIIGTIQQKMLSDSFYFRNI